jgi:hypothetical protein
MRNLWFSSSFLLIVAAALTLSCAAPKPVLPNCASAATGTNTSGSLTSITLCPDAADAQNYPSGQVHFIATGYYNTQPSPVVHLAGTWAACFENIPTDEVTVTGDGVAKCAPGASGEYSVFLSDLPNPSDSCIVVAPCGGGCMVSGYAKLTCP